MPSTYTPRTLTRLNCQVESHRRCVLNSQLVLVGTDLVEKLKTRHVENLIYPVELASKLETGSRLSTGKVLLKYKQQGVCSD